MIKTSKGTILKEDAGMNKIDELLAAVKGYEVEKEDKKNTVLIVAIVILAISAIAAVVYLVYKFTTPKYVDEADFDFDDEDFDDFFEDEDDEPDEEPVVAEDKPAEKTEEN